MANRLRSAWADHSARPDDPDGDVRVLKRALAATVALLVVALAVEVAFAGRSGHGALSDIPGRLIAHHIHAGALPYLGWRCEYPVVVGIVQWIASWFGGTPLGFLLATAAISSGLAVVLVVVVFRTSGARVWHLVLAPAFVLYVFHNWDLVALVPAVAGVLAFDAERDGWSGAFLAVGACAKVFPAVFVPPLVVRRVHERGWRAALPLVVSATVTTLVLNVPFVVGAEHKWAYPFRFQGRRPATWGTLWSVPGRLPVVGSHLELHGGSLADVLSIASLAIGIALLCLVAVRRAPSAVALGAAATGIFLICNKVYSPNYDIWLVPWLALLPVARGYRVAIGATATAVFLDVFGFFHGFVSRSFVTSTLPFLVVARAVVIGALVLAVLEVRRADRRGPARPVPRAKVPEAP